MVEKVDTAAAAPAAAPKGFLDVAVGVIISPSGELLLGQRPEGKPWSGWWEFPGGKLEAGETPLQALARELDEELGIQVQAATPWVNYVHVYPHATVRLHFARVTAWAGTPRGLEQQALRWVDPTQSAEAIAQALGGNGLLPAAYPPLAWWQVPDRLRVSALAGPQDVPGWLTQVQADLAAGVRLVQFRAPGWQGGVADVALQDVLAQTLALTRAARAQVVVNSVHPATWWQQADGVHLRVVDAAQVQAGTLALPPLARIGASAHDAAELAVARDLGAHYALLGPVLPTASHPGDHGLGWPRFAALLAGDVGIPVLALGGQSGASLDGARAHGAHGVAALRGSLAL